MLRALAFVLVTVALATTSCSKQEQTTTSTAAPTASPAPPSAAPTLAAASWCRTVPVEGTFCSVLAVAAPKTTLRLAVADTEARRERGLMGVRRVPASEGMLFAFAGGDQRRDFWMKDTVTPLDMVFVLGDGTITSVEADVPATKPGTPDDRVARRNGVARYVIELASGGAAKAGLNAGDRIAVPDVPAE